MSIINTDEKYVAGTYKRFPVEIVSGKGSVLTDVNGKEYIDMGSGIGVTSFGISDDEWKNAVIDQINKVQHTSNLYYTEPCADLAKALCEKSGMKKVFFSNSGAEANECAIKAARKYASEHKGEDYYKIITLVNSFHGRTLTTLAATGQDCFHKLFTPLTDGFLHVPANDCDAFLKTASENKIAGVMIECIQGEGGVEALDAEFVKCIDSYCKENDLVFIVDEVQSGNGRSGKFYSFMNYGVMPDVVSTAKGLAGGLPIGATLLGEKVQDIFSYGDNGSTFGGNPVSCAAALSIVNRIDGKLLSEVCEKSEYVFNELSSADGVERVSGMGLMIGVKTVKPVAEVIKTCMDNGVLCLSAKDKLRLLPALNIPFDELKKAVEIIKNACKK